MPLRLKAGDRFLLRVEELDPQNIRALWINYPHNPTGATAPYEYLEKVATFCRAHDILLFSDECYNDLYFSDPPPSILEITRERTLAFCSLSKRSGMTGYRSAMMAGDAELIAALKKLRPSIGVATQSFVQDAATAAWNDDVHVEKRRQILPRSGSSSRTSSSGRGSATCAPTRASTCGLRYPRRSVGTTRRMPCACWRKASSWRRDVRSVRAARATSGLLSSHGWRSAGRR